MMKPVFKSADKAFTLLQGDCVEMLSQFDFKFDMIFADPPYFLSNDGISVQSGKMVSVNKGAWDRSNGFEKDNEFNLTWLRACKDHLSENGTIWISGTFHNIFSVAQMLSSLEFRILNCITWAKTNPPPNLSCRYFTHSTEFIIWARRSNTASHYYN
jgi:site-specific DNA-methyltransferase (adenine-specific)